MTKDFIDHGAFLNFCDTVHQNWLNGQYQNDKILNKLFQMDYSPEPYFEVKEGKNPLFLLLTNPGSGMDFQHISNHQSTDFDQYQKVLKDVYTSTGFIDDGGRTAYHRLQKSLEWAKWWNYSGLINVETIPFHSDTLDKKKALKAINTSEVVQEYTTNLKSYLKNKPVLIVSATGTRTSIDKTNLINNKWLMYQLDLGNIDLDRLEETVITKKGNKITSMLFRQDNKYIILMAGSNTLPSLEKYLHRIGRVV